MALKATIRKATLQIADMDRHYYADHSLTLAQHPSETDQRLMVRLLAFAVNASDTLSFTRGLSTDDEPELWERSLTGDTLLWIELGQPEADRIRKACKWAESVRIYAYGGRTVPIWWERLGGKLSQHPNLEVFSVPETACDALTAMIERNMTLQCAIQDGVISLSNADAHVSLELTLLKGL